MVPHLHRLYDDLQPEQCRLIREEGIHFSRTACPVVAGRARLAAGRRGPIKPRPFSARACAPVSVMPITCVGNSKGCWPGATLRSCWTPIRPSVSLMPGQSSSRPSVPAALFKHAILLLLPCVIPFSLWRESFLFCKSPFCGNLPGRSAPDCSTQPHRRGRRPLMVIRSTSPSSQRGQASGWRWIRSWVTTLACSD